MAESRGEIAKFKHKRSLPEAIMNVIKPVYRALAHPDHLKKCLHGRTQNPNESFNNVIWSRVPKNVFVGLRTLKLGVYDSVITFNNGNIGRIKVLEKLGLQPGSNTIETMKYMDSVRLRKAESSFLFATKEARKRKRASKLIQEEGADNEDDPEYATGAF